MANCEFAPASIESPTAVPTFQVPAESRRRPLFAAVAVCAAIVKFGLFSQTAPLAGIVYAGRVKRRLTIEKLPEIFRVPFVSVRNAIGAPSTIVPWTEN